MRHHFLLRDEQLSVLTVNWHNANNARFVMR